MLLEPRTARARGPSSGADAESSERLTAPQAPAAPRPKDAARAPTAPPREVSVGDEEAPAPGKAVLVRKGTAGSVRAVLGEDAQKPLRSLHPRAGAGSWELGAGSCLPAPQVLHRSLLQAQPDVALAQHHYRGVPEG